MLRDGTPMVPLPHRAPYQEVLASIIPSVGWAEGEEQGWLLASSGAPMELQGEGTRLMPSEDWGIHGSL